MERELDELAHECKRLHEQNSSLRRALGSVTGVLEETVRRELSGVGSQLAAVSQQAATSSGGEVSSYSA